MNDSFDDGLALALKSAVPELPGEFDPLDIIRAPRPRNSRHWVAPLAVAALVAGIAVGIVAARSGDHRASHAVVGQRVSQLYGEWVLTDLRGMNGAAHTRPEYPAAFGFAADGNVHGACVASQSTITSESITFDHGWPDLGVAGGCRRLSTAQGAFVFGLVLHGTTPWHVAGGELTMGRPTASIVLTRPEDLEHGQVRTRLYQLAIDAAGGRGIQIARAAAAFAETGSLASSVLHLSPSPYTGPAWLLQIRAEKQFICGECHQIPGRGPQRFRYIYLFADLEARHFARAGLSETAADLAALGRVIRLRGDPATPADVIGVPAVVGLSGYTAAHRLLNAGFSSLRFVAQVSPLPLGRVLAQSPRPGATGTDAAKAIRLTVSAGSKPSASLVTVPGLSTCIFSNPPSRSCVGGPIFAKVIRRPRHH